MDYARPLPADVLARVSKFEALEEKITELWGHLNAATYRFLILMAGLEITAHTSRSRWLGESMDYGLAVEGMQTRDRVAAAGAAG